MNRYSYFTKLLVFAIILFCFEINLINEVSSLSEENESWIKKPPMSIDRVGHGIVTCNDKIYVIGGYNKSGFLDSVESYDPVIGLWETKTPMPYGRAEFGICAIGHLIYIIGGCHTLRGGVEDIYPANVLNSVIVYDTKLDSWSFKTPMPTPRVSLGLCVVDNKIYAIGGAILTWNDCCFYFYNASGANEVYDPINDSWDILPSMITPRHHIGVVCIGDNIFTCGGNKGSDLWPPEKIVEIYSTSFKTWETSIPLPLKLTGFGIASFNYKIYTFGGLCYPDYHVNYVFEYDPINKQWNNMSSMPTARYGLSSCTINDKIYAIGGATDGVRSIFSKSNNYLTDIEEFTPPPLDITQEPNIFITFPKENSKISGNITIYGTASVFQGKIKSVQIKIDLDSWKTTNGTNNWNFYLDTSTLNDGDLTISVRSYDGLRFSNIKTINVTVQNIQEPDKNDDSPGFEFVFTFCAIFLILLYKLKKNK